MNIAPIIATYGGAEFNLASPEAGRCSIEDVAHALSHLCRFTGHTREFYSVAQHSWHCSHLVAPKHAYAALMHDAAEAFIGDIATPLKAMLPEYRAIEHRIEAAVFAQFNVPNPLPPEVKQADLRMLATEKRDLLPASCGDWAILEGIEPIQRKIMPFHAEMAKGMFLQRYAKLRGRA